MEKQMLKNKVAIITGAASGMGRSMAELFADEGATVIVVDINSKAINKVVDEIKSKGQKAFGIVANIGSP
ncbi:Short-chain alcohol dehydrogenase of unknown specificity, partial [Snodgrassella alvi SCGC AB-598-O02]